MNALIITLFVVSLIFLCVAYRIASIGRLWRKLFYKQRRISKIQKETIEMQKSTIESYKKMMAKGICYIPDEHKN